LVAPEQQTNSRETEGQIAAGDAGQSLSRYWQPRYWPTWLFLGWLKLTSLLPWQAAIALHRRLGRALWYLLPRSRRVVRRNLEICFPELTAAQIDSLARRHFENIGASLAEIALAWFDTPPRAKPPARIEGLEHLHAALAKGKGVILFTGHFTTLEIANQCLKPEIPRFAFMYRPRNSPLLNEMQTRGRQRTAHVSLANTAIRGMLRELGRNAAVWYAPDQAYISNSAELMPFFGEPAMTNTGTSRLARLSGAVVVPLHFRRLENGAGYLLRLEAPLEGFPSDDLGEDPRRLTAVLERFIRECPEQYFWTHRKFKNRGPGFADAYARKPS